MKPVELKRGDTGKAIGGVLADEVGPVSLLGASVKFLMKPTPESGLSAPVVNAAAVVVDPNAAEGDPNRGRVRYFPLAADVNVAGIFRGEFQATWGDGRKLTFPGGDEGPEYIEIIIYPDLGD